MQLSQEETNGPISSQGHNSPEESSTHSRIINCIRTGGVLELQKLSRFRSAFDEADDRGWFPLHEASVQPLEQILEVTLDASYPSVREQCTHAGETALMLAVLAGRAGNVRALLERGVQPDGHDDRGDSALLAAVRAGSHQLASLLLRHGADPNLACAKRWTAVHEAARGGRSHILALLLHHRGDPNRRDAFAVTPLAVAALHGRVEALEQLIHKGGDVGARACDGESALFEAARGGSADCVALLLRHGADANAPSMEGRLPIHSAARHGHYLALQQLAEATSPQAIAASGVSPVHVAADGGHAECLRLLLEGGRCDVNAALATHAAREHGDGRRSALFFAVANGDVVCARLLLQAGALPNQDPLNALVVAVQSGDRDLARLLLRHGADVNFRSTLNSTRFPSALQYALKDEATLRLLMNYGCDVRSCFECSHGDDDDPTRMVLTSSVIEDVPFCEVITLRWLWRWAGPVVLAMMDYVDHVRVCPKLRLVLRQNEQWPEIDYIMSNARPLKHLCRLALRACIGTRRLQDGDCLATLPLPRALRTFLLHEGHT
ncbi:ankyrin repeat and SOCS box protein 15 [Lethenteron reissneri]|uniref:ankyrin repeat and SOCS box protein 15 n=1 Tax=Lethenteron reissneri TaxID=7753 RepID=UPI002AB6172B|nr:ankyrin repeat and SOCS box protein 15 [Lethenteron reissneri]